MTQLFASIASLIQDVMSPSVDKWVKTMRNASDGQLGGVTLTKFTRHLIYTQMMVPLKVSMLAGKISQTYLNVSDKYILPAQRSVYLFLMDSIWITSLT
jgi:hypothetical protein